MTMQKFDPYINVDPGTMNPVQHGEVFVTDDGTETDLDLGHYERFIDECLDKKFQCDHGEDLLVGLAERTSRRLWRRHRAGDSAHYE